MTRLRPVMLLELVVQRQPALGGDLGGEKPPGEHGEEVAEQQAEDEVEGARAPGHEQRPDHELGAGGVFAGVHAPEGAGAFPGLLGHRLALELVAGVVRLVRRSCFGDAPR